MMTGVAEIVAGIVALLVPAVVIGFIVLGRTRPVFLGYLAMVAVGIGYLVSTGAVGDIGQSALAYLATESDPAPNMAPKAQPTQALAPQAPVAPVVAPETPAGQPSAATAPEIASPPASETPPGDAAPAAPAQ